MALATRVQNRVRTQLLIELTNPNDKTATTVETTVLGYAVTDTAADFETYAGVAYDDTDARHVAEAVRGVVVRLEVNAGRAKAERLTEWQDRMDRMFRLRHGNDRIMPQSSSRLTPQTEAPSGEVRPWFDLEETFNDLIPNESPVNEDV